jgi:hypothetical protein
LIKIYNCVIKNVKNVTNVTNVTNVKMKVKYLCLLV